VTEAAIVERYLLLGLRLDRHVDGTVDAYFGPAELSERVRSEPLTDASALAADAEWLLDALEDGWLRDQVAGLHTFAGVLAGESLSYADEVERCYGVRPAFTDEAVFAAEHESLERLLPGAGSLAERYDRWRTTSLVPTERVGELVTAITAAAREQTRALVDLPEGEGFEVAVVTGQPWLAFNAYLGDLQSRIDVNTDLPHSAYDMLHLAIHEGYPGHHAERCIKEQLLVRERGMLEESIVLVPTPQSLVAEGIAELGPALLLEGDGGEALAAVAGDAGLPVDLAHSLAVDRAAGSRRWVQVNAALMLHEQGAGEAEVRAYLERWGLMTPELSAHLIRFMNESTSRSYVITYPAGQALCRSWVDGDPSRVPRLLCEQVRVGELVESLNGAPLAPQA
jgi:hypothetical protein